MEGITEGPQTSMHCPLSHITVKAMKKLLVYTYLTREKRKKSIVTIKNVLMTKLKNMPHNSLATDTDAQYQHALAELDHDVHQQHHGKPKGLRASKRNNTELDAGHHHGRPKAPVVGHRSKPPKNVNFPDDTDDRFI